MGKGIESYNLTDILNRIDAAVKAKGFVKSRMPYWIKEYEGNIMCLSDEETFRKYIRRISTFLEVNEDWLIFGDGKPASSDNQSELITLYLRGVEPGIGKRIAAVLKSRQILMIEIEKDLRIPEGHVSLYKYEKRIPNIKRIVSMADYLGVSKMWLACYEGQPFDNDELNAMIRFMMLDIAPGLGQRVRILRISKGLSQIKLAHILGTNENIISRIETEKCSVDLFLLYNIAKVLEADEYWLATGIRSSTA